MHPFIPSIKEDAKVHSPQSPLNQQPSMPPASSAPISTASAAGVRPVICAAHMLNNESEESMHMSRMPAWCHWREPTYFSPSWELIKYLTVKLVSSQAAGLQRAVVPVPQMLNPLVTPPMRAPTLHNIFLFQTLTSTSTLLPSYSLGVDTGSGLRWSAHRADVAVPLQ